MEADSQRIIGSFCRGSELTRRAGELNFSPLAELNHSSVET